MAPTRYARLDGLWHSRSSAEWLYALDHYWDFVKHDRMPVEQEMAVLDPAKIEALDTQGWYEFLLNKYFPWKYTARNRYGSTTKHLKKHRVGSEWSELGRIKTELFTFDRSDIRLGLDTARRIHGLGTAGASGLLAVLFPKFFGTVDQFAVKALREVDDLPERDLLVRMNKDNLSPANGVTLIKIMRKKAAANRGLFPNTHWTPRKIDMILWTFGRSHDSAEKNCCKRRNCESRPGCSA